MKKISIISSVANGNLKRNRNLIASAIKSFEGKDIEITLQLKRKSRSNNQNAYYWGVVINLVQQGLLDATGELRSANDIHYKILLPMFAPMNDIANKETGEVISERITSSEMTTTQFMEYVLSIQKWAAEFLCIDIPSPNEQEMLNLE